MNAIIASDIHGSITAFRKLEDQLEALRVDRLVLLGDVLYHGPRNDLPAGYALKELIARLNERASMITCVRGNCDAEVDQMVLDFPIMSEYSQIELNGYAFFLTHGHRAGQSETDLPHLAAGTIFASGHTHVKRLERAVGPDGSPLVLLNPGSTSIPKDGMASFAYLHENELSLRALDGGILKTLELA